MASLKELRSRIGSVKQTQKITSAMKLVAASKLKKAQDQAEAARPFAERMSSMLTNLAAGVADAENAPKLMAGTGSDNIHLLIVATADRGLCGGFNSSIVRGTRKKITELEAEGKKVKLLCIGRKGADQLRRDHRDKIVEVIDGVGKSRLAYDEVAAIALKIEQLFEAGEFDVCTIVFNAFKSVITQVMTMKQLIPVETPESEDAGDEVKAVYDFEPEEDVILEELLPRNLAVQIYGAMTDNAASEQGARMAAMDNATRNAGEMIDKLTLIYNRTRQAKITSELIEIISGAEAL